MSTWTAADIGAYDQYLAGADAEIDQLLSILQISTGEVGEHQALANVAALLDTRDDKRVLLGLLMTALRRLTREADTRKTGEQ